MSKGNTQYPSTVYVVYYMPDGKEEPYHLVFADKDAAIDDDISNGMNVGVYSLKEINRPIINRSFAED